MVHLISAIFIYLFIYLFIFLGGAVQNEHFVFVTKFGTYPENVIPKCFVLDDLVRKNHFLWILPMLDDCNNDLKVLILGFLGLDFFLFL